MKEKTKNKDTKEEDRNLVEPTNAVPHLPVDATTYERKEPSLEGRYGGAREAQEIPATFTKTSEKKENSPTG